MHKFTEAGLGQSPFELSDLVDLGGNTGSCDFCGKQNIRYQCIVKSSDGVESCVGTSCVEKCHDYRLGREVKASLNSLKLANKIAKIKEFEVNMENNGVANWLRSQPHPFQNRADEGMTLFNYFEFCLKNQNANDLLKTINWFQDQFDGE